MIKEFISEIVKAFNSIIENTIILIGLLVFCALACLSIIIKTILWLITYPFHKENWEGHIFEK